MQKIYGKLQSGTRFIEELDQKYQEFFPALFLKSFMPIVQPICYCIEMNPKS